MTAASSLQSETLWLRRKEALARFNLGWRRLEKWRLEGLVRSIKLDEAKSGTRLYFTQDINDVLMSLSAGRKPSIKIGRTGS
jgi:hypothetical protein